MSTRMPSRSIRRKVSQGSPGTHGCNGPTSSSTCCLFLPCRGSGFPTARSVCALELYAAHDLDFEDALAVAHMERQDIAEIYSYDRDFDGVAQVGRLEP